MNKIQVKTEIIEAVNILNLKFNDAQYIETADIITTDVIKMENDDLSNNNIQIRETEDKIAKCDVLVTEDNTKSECTFPDEEIEDKRVYRNTNQSISPIELINDMFLRTAKIILQRIDSNCIETDIPAVKKAKIVMKKNTQTVTSKRRTKARLKKDKTNASEISNTDKIVGNEEVLDNSKTLGYKSPQTFRCDVCKKHFYDNYGLNRHKVIHTGEKPYKCDVCKLRFTQKHNLVRHFRIHTGEKPYKCHLCERCFNQKQDLTHHVRLHTGEQPYKCDFCDKRFQQSCIWKQHIRTHTGEKPYKCNICEKGFTRKESLEDHINIHTGEKPYKCDQCEKRFTRRHYFREHVQTCIHSDGNPQKRMHYRKIKFVEKLYKCDLCEICFINKQELENHSCVRVSEKPYKCDVCENSYKQSSHLYRHIHLQHSLKNL